jgi:L-malate glycosyltransferase
LTDDNAPLRICVLGDLESVHTRRWMRPFVEKGHEVHAISYYRPSVVPEGVQLHVLDDRAPSAPAGPAAMRPAPRIPPDLLRIINALRYRRRGLARVIRDVGPDVLHAHYVVEYGLFAAAAAGFHPLVVSAWGSDVLVAAPASPLSRAIARYTLRRADLITSTNEYMTGRLRDLGVPPDKLATIVFGADPFYLERAGESVNVRPPEAGHRSTIVSVRSLDSPLYNVDLILRAVALLRARVPDVQLFIAGAGRLRPALEALARDLELGESVRFLGWLDDAALRNAYAEAEVYVSVPNSDSSSVSMLSAMAAGSFPVISDLPTQHEWVEDGVNGFLVPLGNPRALAQRLADALESADLRREAAARNRCVVEERGLWSKNASLMEDWYHRLAAARTKVEGDATRLSR